MRTDKELHDALQDALTLIHAVRQRLEKPLLPRDKPAQRDRLDQAGAKIAGVQIELKTR
jgi:hypothetical protein